MGIRVLKSELVKRIAAKRPLLRESDLERAVNAFLNEIAGALSRGDRVELRGFGVFSVHRHRPRPARNPRTGAPIQLGPRSLPAFKIGRQLNSRLNKPEAPTCGWINVAQPVAEE